jgi:hypothetical protein
LPRGAVLDMKQIWDLARLWYHDRLNPDWTRRTPVDAQEVFASIGLTDDFWNLA